ncbi:MAG: magnesium transporter [Gemmatimonadota bacterium]|nr:magnesium transporter [Gemmatimonadota bacterium]
MTVDLEKVKRLLGLGEAGRDELLELVKTTHPADLADIVEQMEEEERALFFNLIPAEIASETLAETRDEDQEEVIKSLDDQTIHEVFEELSDDDATDIVQELSDQEAERVMRVIDTEDREEIQTLLKYDEDTAGGVMTTELVAVEMGRSAAEAIELVREQGREIRFYTIYVIDSKRILQGTVSVTDLILANPDALISEIMDTDIVSVPPEMDQEDVARLMGRYNLVSLPVMDDGGVLLGRVTVDDVIDILEEEVTEDMFRMSGVDEDESIEKTGVIHSVRSRLPWLCLNLIFIIISVQVIGLFLQVIERVVVLAMFLPVVAGIGGNASTQSMAVTLRRLILDGAMKDRRRRVLFHEAVVGLLNGLMISLIIFAVVYFTQHNILFALIVGAAAWTSMTLAGFIGAFIPIVLKALGFDPTVSSSVVHNITDIIGFFLLLGLSALLLIG